MLNDSMRTVLVALGTGLGVALAKAVAAACTGSTLLAAEAAHSLADTGNDLSLFVAQRHSLLSVAAAVHPTISIPWGMGGKPTSGR
jgi:divalent metal cation (Fe/Co/Zn/Cd) transporter